PDFAIAGTCRHPAARRAQAEQAAVGCGNTNGTAAIVGTGHRDYAAGHRGCSAAAGSAGRARRRPGITGRSESLRFGDALECQLRRVRLAKADQSGSMSAFSVGGTDGGTVGLESAGALAGRMARSEEHTSELQSREK